MGDHLVDSTIQKVQHSLYLARAERWAETFPQILCTEMEKRVDTGDISVLIFFSCANFLAAYPQTNYKHCAVLDCAKSN